MHIGSPGYDIGYSHECVLLLAFKTYIFCIQEMLMVLVGGRTGSCQNSKTRHPKTSHISVDHIAHRIISQTLYILCGLVSVKNIKRRNRKWHRKKLSLV